MGAPGCPQAGEGVERDFDSVVKDGDKMDKDKKMKIPTFLCLIFSILGVLQTFTEYLRDLQSFNLSIIIVQQFLQSLTL